MSRSDIILWAALMTYVVLTVAFPFLAVIALVGFAIFFAYAGIVGDRA